MKFELIDNYKEAWKFVSVNCMAIAGALQASWLYIPEDLKQHVPGSVVTAVTVSLLVLGILGRLKKQSNVVGPECNPKDGHTATGEPSCH